MRHIYNKLVICFMIGIGIGIISSMITMTITASKEPLIGEKYVTSVYIEDGDSLWSIAEQYFTEKNISMKEYIEEIKECNHLSSNEIKKGQYLIVPYYEVIR